MRDFGENHHAATLNWSIEIDFKHAPITHFEKIALHRALYAANSRCEAC